VLLLASLAGAQAAAGRRCGGYYDDADQLISSCTALIQEVGENSVLYQFYEKRGYAYFRKGDYERAIADFDESVRRNAGAPEAYSFRGVVYDAKGDYDRAIQDFDGAIGSYTTNANDLNLRGNAYRHKGDYDRAIRDYDQALELVSIHIDNVLPQIHARFLNNRGLAKQAKGDVAGANADFAEAKQIDPLTQCSTSPKTVLMEQCFSSQRAVK
jgi:tetratricopeptide (TPR) repeat protein